MRFRRVVLAGAMSACLVGVLGAGQAAAATGGSHDGPGGSSGPLGGLTDTVQGLLGQDQHGREATAPDPSPTPSTRSDPSGPLSGLLPSDQSSDPPGGSQGSSHSHHSTGSHESTDSGVDGGALPLISSLPLPDPGENVPNHLCLPEQLQSALPSSVPSCLNLTVCKQGLVRDLQALPTVKLNGLAEYVQRVLGDLTACLTSLVPELPTAAPTQASEPPTSPQSSPPEASYAPAPPPSARPATPVKQEPNFTG
ncbi:MAG: hypothetical protein ACRDMV_12520 [Streptosporangiales bacterium]